MLKTVDGWLRLVSFCWFSVFAEFNLDKALAALWLAAQGCWNIQKKSEVEKK